MERDYYLRLDGQLASLPLEAIKKFIITDVLYFTQNVNIYYNMSTFKIYPGFYCGSNNMNVELDRP